jgi:vacuolar-type H+-ATPase catalytic subunit A/Vma1
MWRKFYEYARQLLAIKVQTDRNSEEIKEMREEMKQMAEALRDLRYEVKAVRENEEHERQKLILQLENTLLHFERRWLPPQNRNTSEE